MTDIRLGNSTAAARIERPAVAQASSSGNAASKTQAKPQEMPATQPAQENVPVETLKVAVEKINDFMQSLHRDLNFTIDQDSGKTVVKVLDTKTQELVRQIPNETAITIAKNIDSSLRSLGLLNERT